MKQKIILIMNIYNELYLDYKKRNFRIKKLREESNKEDGISFIRNIYKNYK